MLGTYELPHYILEHYSDKNITPLKLQKLLYYVKVWGIVAGVELYQGEFLKWKHGPVNVDVYHHYKSFERGQIVMQPETARIDLDTQEKEMIDFIVSAYIPFSAISLSALTHKELPWQNTSQNAVIGHADILDFYSQQPFANNFNPFDLANKPYFPVQSNSWYAYILDMSPDDVQRHTQFSSFQAYQTQLREAQADTGDENEILQSLICQIPSE